MELDKIRLTTDDGRPLWWDHFPLVWTCPPSTSPAVIAAYARGIFEWQKKADLESIGLFRPYNAIDTRADVLLAGDLFPVDLDPSTGFDLPDVGFLSPHHAAPEFRPALPRTGEARLTWDADGRILGGVATIHKAATMPELREWACHELGHLLTLGHWPHEPRRIMYHSTTGRLTPTKAEGRLVAEVVRGGRP